MSYIHPSSIIHPKAVIGKDCEIREFCVIGSTPTYIEPDKRSSLKGIRIGRNVFINCHADVVVGTERDTTIGDDCILGQHVIIGHDSIIGRKVRINNNVSINGWVEIEDHTFVGSGSIIRNRIKIGANCLIGQGSNVVKDIPGNSVAYGNPCHFVKKNENEIMDLIRRYLL